MLGELAVAKKERPESSAGGVFFSELQVGGERLAIISLPVDASYDFSSLTPAERAVARALLKGQSNSAIATTRGSSERTVGNQVASVFRKLGIASRSELAAWVIINRET